jgi:hypothetical protein
VHGVEALATFSEQEMDGIPGGRPVILQGQGASSIESDDLKNRGRDPRRTKPHMRGCDYEGRPVISEPRGPRSHTESH